MQDSLNLEKMTYRVEKYRQRERRYQWLSLAIFLIAAILLLADIVLLAPMAHQFRTLIDKNPENLTTLMQGQLVEMMSLAAELTGLFVLIGLLHWRSQRAGKRKKLVRYALARLLPDLEHYQSHMKSGAFNLSSMDTQRLRRAARMQQGVFVLLLAFGFFVGLTGVFPWLSVQGVRSPLAMVMALFFGLGGGYILVYGVLYSFTLFPYAFIHDGPLAHGDYDGALAQWRRWGGRMPLMGVDPLIGYSLLLAGRQEEARSLWRWLLVQAFMLGHPLHAALRLINFASSLENSGYDVQIAHLFEGGVRIAPESAVTYRSLAGYYLSADVHPERALALTAMMLDVARPPRNSLFLQRFDWSLTLGIRAMALAKTGHPADADAMMDRAFAETDPQFQPGIAWLHYSAGCIQQMKKQDSAAADHFGQAVKLDPHGQSGGLARMKLSKMDDANG